MNIEWCGHDADECTCDLPEYPEHEGDALADATDTYGPISADHLRGLAFIVRHGRNLRDWLTEDPEVACSEAVTLSRPTAEETTP